MVKKVRKYILFFIVGLIQAFISKPGSAYVGMGIARCSDASSPKKCCESLVSWAGDVVKWNATTQECECGDSYSCGYL